MIKYIFNSIPVVWKPLWDMQVHGHCGRPPRVAPGVAMVFSLHHGPRVAQHCRGPWRARETSRVIQLKGTLYNLVHETRRRGRLFREKKNGLGIPHG